MATAATKKKVIPPTPKEVKKVVKKNELTPEDIALMDKINAKMKAEAIERCKRFEQGLRKLEAETGCSLAIRYVGGDALNQSRPDIAIVPK